MLPNVSCVSLQTLTVSMLLRYSHQQIFLFIGECFCVEMGISVRWCVRCALLHLTSYIDCYTIHSTRMCFEIGIYFALLLSLTDCRCRRSELRSTQPGSSKIVTRLCCPCLSCVPTFTGIRNGRESNVDIAGRFVVEWPSSWEPLSSVL